TAPVVRVAVDHDTLVRQPFDEFERTGAGGVAAIVLAVLLHGGRRDDQPGRIGKVGEEWREGFLQLELDRVRIDYVYRLDRRKVEGEGKWPGVVERVVLTKHAVEVEFHRVGIEIGAVVEFHALAQLERVGSAILGNVPALGKGRLDFERTVLEADEAVIDI